MSTESRTSSDPWEAFLDPDWIRPRLIGSAIFLAAYEILCESIIGRIRGFYVTGVDESGLVVDKAYKTEVLARNTSPVYASLAWLEEQGAIDRSDCAVFEELRKTRNRIAHELSEITYKAHLSNGMDEIPALAALLRKIEVWWVINVEIPVNPDFANAEIDEKGILPGPVMSLQMLLTVGLGPIDEARVWLTEFRTKRGLKDT